MIPTIIQTVIHHPAVSILAALLSLVAVTFLINRLGLLAWIEWLKHHESKVEDTAAPEYWSVHQ
jgi:hypothetical protein